MLQIHTILYLLVAFAWPDPVCDFRRVAKVGAGGLDAAVPTGTVIGLFDDADKDGCIVDYSIDDEDVQVLLGKVFHLCEQSPSTLDQLTYTEYRDDDPTKWSFFPCHTMSITISYFP